MYLYFNLYLFKCGVGYKSPMFNYINIFSYLFI